MIFYLGTPEPSWLRRVDVPLCVSRRRLAKLRRWPVARAPWILDSGGFTELASYGEWRTGRREYIAFVRRAIAEIGSLVWVAPQDWMCEPQMVNRTRRTVEQHQRLTVANVVALRYDMGSIVAPVLQGYAMDDYLRCAALYDAAGIDLASEPVVGLGSVCRRTNTGEVASICRQLAGYGWRLHGFGLKTLALSRVGALLASSDSMAWSYRARRSGVSSWSLPFALDWRARQLSRVPSQLCLAI